MFLYAVCSQEYNPEATNAVAKREKKKPDGAAPATPSTEHGGQPGDRGRSGHLHTSTPPPSIHPSILSGSSPDFVLVPCVFCLHFFFLLAFPGFSFMFYLINHVFCYPCFWVWNLFRRHPRFLTHPSVLPSVRLSWRFGNFTVWSLTVVLRLVGLEEC